MAGAIERLFTNLRHEYGERTITVPRPGSQTRAMGLIAPDGSPIDLGFFENRGYKSNTFAVTRVPAHAHTVHHRVQLMQGVEEEAEALLIEDDSAIYLEGLDRTPTEISRRELREPEITDMLRKLVDGALVLEAGQLAQFDSLKSEVTMPMLRLVGGAMHEAQQGLGYVSLAAF
jgi:hypothetical protein